ncbi:MAG: hypothetical protein HY727_09160, partial [Candidatus Rokubacteria bacterium]|nr:hypothetical protein [Candidatus Rokubacteria bacterium]
FGFSTQACSVMGCGVPVLPVIGLAVTGVSSETLVFFSRLARIGTATVLAIMTVAVAWLGWLAGGPEVHRPTPGVRAVRGGQP